MFRQHKAIRWWRLRHSVLIMVFVTGAVVSNPCVSQAKADDEQTQIILLNDSAAAIDDSDPKLSLELTKFADEKEKDWEYRNANKITVPTPVTAKDMPRLRREIDLLKAASLEIKPVYPLIAQSLRKMADGINKTIEIKE